MKRDAWIIAGAVLAVLVIGGGVIVYDRKRVAAELRAAFRRYKLPEEWGEALGRTESDLDPSAINLGGPDGARGGSYGATQISERTARAFGYLRPMDALRVDIETMADLTARMVADGFAERSTTGPYRIFRYGPPSTIEDMAAVWNAGRQYSDPKLPSSTRTVYVPRMITNLGKAVA